VSLKPDDANAHNNLGRALNRQGKVNEAIESYRESIRLKPRHAAAHGNLGLALAAQGKPVEALIELRAAHELGGKASERVLPGIDKMIATLERQVRLRDSLPAILSGREPPRDNSDRLALAQMCYDTKRYDAAARFWNEAMMADSKLATDRQAEHRYNAACAAALAGAGEGKDEPKPDETAKAKLRGQAMEWLKAELDAWDELLGSGPPQGAAAIAQVLKHWKEDTDLSGIRDGDHLAKLPASERNAWQLLWADVEGLLERAKGPTPAKDRTRTDQASGKR
jgi:tetratricopeptide (TPR) repeat protein